MPQSPQKFINTNKQLSAAPITFDVAMNIFKLSQKFPLPKKSTHSNQSGFTIIESLVAIMVISILLIGLSPVIVLSVAARVQSRRVERATEVARTYIDGVRAGSIPAPAVEELFPLSAPLRMVRFLLL